MTEFIIFAIATTLSTLVGSFSGGGSSLILLPMLFAIFPAQQYIYLFTAGKVAATVMSWTSASIHHKRTKNDKKLILVLIAFGMVGTAIGTFLLQSTSNEAIFKMLLAGTLIITAALLIKSKELGIESKEHHSIHHLYTKAAIASLLINILNGIFGGTGILLTIFCVIFLGMTFIESVSATIMTYIIINTLQTGYLLNLVDISTPTLIGAVAGALLGSTLGTHLQYLKGNKWVKTASILVMITLSIYLIYNSLGAI